MKPVVYLLPGLLCDAFVWADQTRALRDRFEVRVPDFTTQASIEAMARTVLDDAPELFCLGGHSMGGRVAMEIVRQAPERVDRLALLDTGSHPVQPGEREKRQDLLDLAQAQGMTALAQRWLPPMVQPDRLDDPTLMPGLTAMVERMSPAIFRNQITALLDRPDAGPVLPRIRCPVLIGVGRNDLWSPPAQHEAMAALIGQARYVVFEDSGHMAPVERPHAVTAALADWLEGAAAARAAV